jgi:hypothetical protein
MTKSDVKRTIEALQNKHRRFPKLSEIGYELHLPEYKVSAILKLLVEDGWLVRIGNNYRIGEKVDLISQPLVQPPMLDKDDSDQRGVPEPVKAIPAHETTTPKAPEPAPAPAEPVPVEKEHTPRWIIMLLRVLMGFIGIGAVAASAYYTAVWNLGSMPAWLGILLAGIIVGFTTIAFETAYLMWMRRMYAAAAAFSIIWIVAATYSMGTTVSGQYDDWARAETARLERIAQLKQTTAEYEAAVNDYNAKAKTRDNHQASRDAAQKVLDTVESMKDRANLRTNVGEAQAEVTKQDKQLLKDNADVAGAEAKMNGLKALLPPAALVEPVPTTYEWAGAVLKMEPSIIQFIMSLIPAIFIEIIAPASLAVAMFLGNGSAPRPARKHVSFLGQIQQATQLKLKRK